MIVDFTVSNYRSIKEPVTLSFIAQKGRTSKNGNGVTVPSDDSICPGYEVKGRDFKLVPIAAVFGANASGKSNVIRALDTLIELMVYQREGRNPFPSSLSVFALNKQNSELPICFRLRFADEGAIFTFELEVRKGVVEREQLHYSPAPNQRQSIRLLYTRVFNFEKQEYEISFGEMFSGPHTQLLASVKKHELYFALLDRVEAPLVGDFVGWLRMSLCNVFCGGEDIDLKMAAGWFAKYPEDRYRCLQILQMFDTGIHNLDIISTGEDEHRVKVVHKVDGEYILWDFEEESLGTQRLFSLLYSVIIGLDFKHVLIVDELGANFHPKITREIIKLFHSPETNPYGAQLVFTSHDNTLWRGVLRRDEIWLTEKQEDQSTKLMPLSAYKPRNDLALDKAYLDGRFGAVPLIGDVSEVFEKATDDKGVEEKELADVA